MTTCTYSFQTSQGDETIKGMADMKAFLALNGVDAIVASGKPIFSREANSGKSIKKQAIQNAVNELRKVWKNAPEIIVVQDMNDPAIRKAVRDENQRQLSQGAEGQPEGFFDSGRVYIVADEMKSPDDVARVVFHETLGHYGLRGVYGDKLDRVLDSVYMARRQLVLAKAAQYGLDFTKERDRRIASEEVLAEMAQTNPQAGLVQRAIAAIRQFLRDIGVKLELTDNDIIVNYLLPARNFVVNGSGQNKRPSDVLFNRADIEPTLANLFKTLAGNDEAFKYGRSDSKSLQKVFDTALPNLVRVDTNNYPPKGMAEQYFIYPISKGRALTNNEGTVNVYEDGRVEVNVLPWDKGQGGSGVYAAVGNFAYNNNYVFAGDRDGITADGKMRRLENMISLALKFGTTDHIMPHEDQLKDLKMEWKEGDTQHNLQKMLEASYRIIRNGLYSTTKRNGISVTQIGGKDAIGVKKLDDLFYNIDTNQFIDKSNGKPYTDADFRELAGEPEARATNAGWSTLKRAALAHTFLEGTSEERQRLLEQLGRLSRQSLVGNQLRAVLYSRSTPQIDNIEYRQVPFKSTSSGNRGAIEAYVDGELIGDLSLYQEDGKYELSTINVKPKYRRQGIATQMLKQAQDYVGGDKIFTKMLTPDGRKFFGSMGVKRGDVPDIRNNGAVNDVLFSRNQTDTPQFKAWFSDSKVVDADGKPLVVYHGTKSDITAFSPTKGNGLLGDGIYTTADRKQASETYAGATSGSNVMPLYVSIQNPLVTEVGYDVPLNWQELGYDGVIYNKNNEPAWFVAANANQVKSAIGNNGDFNPNNPDIRFSRSNAQQSNLIPKWDAPTDNKLDDVVYALQDKHIDLKRVSQSIKKAGTDIADRWNAYLQEELYHGRTAKRTQDFIKDDLDPLIEDMRMRGVAMADFEEYLWARHAEERNIQIAKINPDMPDAGSGMSTKDARDYLAGLTAEKKANYQALAKRIDDINRKSRQVLVDYGLESKETISAWEGAYKNYVPLMREDMDAGFGNGTGQGFSVKGNAAKRATGSNRAVVDVIANIAQQFEKNVIRGEKNRVSTALIGLAELNPNKEFWQVDNPPKIKTVSKTTGLVEEYTDPNYKNRNNVVVARTIGANGKVVERAVVFNQFDKRAMRMAGSIKNLDQDQVGELLGMASNFTRYFASINTQFNPIFGVINIVRDVQGALLNLSTTPIADKKAEVLKNTPSAWLGIYQDLRAARKGGAANSQWADLFEEFQNEGGQTGFRNMYANAQDRSEAIRNALDPLWWQNSTMGKLISANGMLAKPQQWMFEKAVKPIFDWLSDYNTSLENAVRLSVYKVALDNGHSKQQAASMAKNISVNFNRKGEMGRQIGALYAFFNASVQGTARIGETLLNRDDAGRLSLSTSGKRIVQGGLLLGAMQALLLASAGYSDDEPPEFVRDRSLIMPLDMFGADGKYLTLPMPLGFNAIPSLGRILTEWALSGGDKTQERLVHILDMVLNVTNPIGNAGLSLQTIAPTVIDPLAALAENKDFTGRPIAREDFNSLNPTAGFTRSRDKAWDFSVAIARAINWITGGNDYKQGAISPTADQLEYLAGQFTGGVGREIIKAGTTADSLLTGEDLPTYKIPLVGRFIGDSTGQASQGAEFYANVRTMNEYQNEIKGIVSQGGDVTAFMADHPEARMAKVADLALKQVQNLRKQQRALKEAGDSREQVTIIDERITAIMARLNENIRELKETAE